MEKRNQNRRQFIGQVAAAGLVSLPLASVLASCADEGEDKEEGISPNEDLMQEHGILNRVLLIYDELVNRINSHKDFDPQLLYQAAMIIRKFIEDYHEKQEELYLFPRFEKAGQHTELVTTLRVQHQQGGLLTSTLMSLGSKPRLGDREYSEIKANLSAFIRMYRPHESREDTVLFPAFKKLVSAHEYNSLGEEFEKNEHKMFGKDGYLDYLAKTESIEKALDIYDLGQFTPVQNQLQ
ncbi:hemerythrin domain-containing protein [Flavobacterium sp.]|uniref:hemerythrin domain-containing protein n=1 Tax=Flavobacterium sp. TaxID=239 RepID=UPI0026082040|nr:hemerythrin domain-containing protein [Flavobacterium sp.]